MILWILCFHSTGWAGTLYIKSDGTKIHAKPSAQAEVIETLSQGAEVDQNGQEGKFLKVSTPSGKTGWVFQFKVAKEAPSENTGGGLLDALGGKKMAVKESTSSSSIRGLSPVSEEHAEKKGISKESIEAVKTMENFKVSSGEVDRFLATRKLGEYQK